MEDSLCQGISMVTKLLGSDESDFTALPYIFWHDHGQDPIRMAIQSHVQCMRRVGSKSANPYASIYNGFHITFYEMVQEPQPLKHYETWKVGHLYEMPADAKSYETSHRHSFRQSAFTVRIYPVHDSIRFLTVVRCWPPQKP